MVVVVPKDAETAPFDKMLILVVEADMWVFDESPMTIPSGTNLPNTVLSSFISNPAELIFTCSASCKPTNTLAPYSASLSPPEFKTFIPALVIWTAVATEAESTNCCAVWAASEADISSDEPLMASANWAEPLTVPVGTGADTVKVPPKVALPLESTENWFPILKPLASIWSRISLPSFNLKLPESINVWEADIGPIVVVVPKEADTLPFVKIFTLVVEAEICVFAVSPITTPSPTNLPSWVSPSLIKKPSELIEMCSLAESPTRVVAPNAATLVPAVKTSTPSDFTNTKSSVAAP